MKPVFFVGLLFLLPAVASGQESFGPALDKLRFTLYDHLSLKSPLRLSPDAAAAISSFLKQRAHELPAYRLLQLREKERDTVGDASFYTPIPDEALQAFRKSAAWIDMKAKLAEMRNATPGAGEPDGFGNIELLWKVVSARPIDVIAMATAQNLPTLLTQQLQLSREDLMGGLAISAIAGTYLSAKEESKTLWKVVANNYYTISIYSVDIDSGNIDLLQILIRK